MNVVTVSILLFFIPWNCDGCSKKSYDELPRYLDENPDGYYTIHNIGNRKCEFKHIDFIQDISWNSDLHRQKKSCNLPPWLQEMAHGYNELMEGFLQTDVSLQFSCAHATKTEINMSIYDLPSSVTVEKYDEIKYSLETLDHEALAKMSANTLDVSECNLRRFRSYRELMNKTRSKIIKVPRVIYKSFVATVLAPHASKSLLFQYRSLPEDLYADVYSYYKFICQYGTAIRQKSILGGELEFIIQDSDKFANENSAQDMLNQIISDFDENSMRKYQIGGENYNSLTTWVESVRNKPVAISSNLISIYDFLDRSGATVKYQSLKDIVKYIRNGEKMNQILNALDDINSDHRLAKFLRSMLRFELKYVCINEQLFDIVQKGILDHRNLLLNKFTIVCKHDRWYWPSKQEEYVITRKFALISGICFTKKVRFSTCKTVHMSLPSEVPCVLFFKDVECRGSFFANVTGDGSLARALIDSKSFTFC